MISGINWWEKFNVEREMFAQNSISLTLIYIYIKIDKRNLIKFTYYFLMIFTFIVEIDKLIFMANKNYVEYYKSYSNNLPSIITFLAGMSFTFLCMYLITLPNKRSSILPLILYILSNIPMLIIGQRNPIIISIIFTITYFIIRDIKEDNK